MGLLNFLFGNNTKTNDVLEDDVKISFEPITNEFNETPDIPKAYSKIFDNGLTIGEIILLDWSDSKKEKALHPEYFSYTYGINWHESLKKLKEMKYLRYATPVEKLPSLKVTELKDILSKAGLKKTGKKADLIERIKTEIDPNEYANDLNFKSFMVTDSGKKILKEFDFIIWSHRKSFGSNSLQPYNLIKYIGSSFSKEDASISILESDFNNNLKHQNYGLAENNLLDQIKIKEMIGEKKTTLNLSLMRSILSMSGLNNADPEYIIFHRNSPNFYFKQSLIDLQDELDISNEDLMAIASDIFDQLNPKITAKIRMYGDKTGYLDGLKIAMFGSLEDLENLKDEWINRIPDDLKIIF